MRVRANGVFDRGEFLLRRARLKSRLRMCILASLLMISSTASTLIVSPTYAEPTVYTVAPGDTLSSIAEQFGVDEGALAAANHIDDPDFLQIGQKLVIDTSADSAPAPSSASSSVQHVVQPGDSLSSIAARYGVAVEAIVQANGLSNPNRIQVGRVLIVPNGQSARVVPTIRGERVTGYIWPTRGNITTYFGERESYYIGGYHTGLDIAGRTGDPVRATARGTVVTAWKRPDNVGWHIVVDHGNGYGSMYAHLSRFLVDVGDVVEQGQVIAAVGNTGFSTGPHLHFEIRLNGQPLNPLDFLP